LLPLVIPAILSGLQDQYDDVRAIAAAALLPVARKLPSLLPQKVREMLIMFGLSTEVISDNECGGYFMG